MDNNQPILPDNSKQVKVQNNYNLKMIITMIVTFLLETYVVIFGLELIDHNFIGISNTGNRTRSSILFLMMILNIYLAVKYYKNQQKVAPVIYVILAAILLLIGSFFFIIESL